MRAIFKKFNDISRFDRWFYKLNHLEMYFDGKTIRNIKEDKRGLHYSSFSGKNNTGVKLHLKESWLYICYDVDLPEDLFIL